MVADLFNGDPSQLPLRDGAVDLGQAGVVSDGSADVAHFGLAWPEPDGNDSRETLVVVSLADIQATYVEPVSAAETCDDLADTIAGLFDTYTDEVALMTAEGFTDSPLSMIDDLRFGAAGQRSQQLDCGEELEAAVRARFCVAPPPAGSAAAVICDSVCEAGG